VGFKTCRRFQKKGQNHENADSPMLNTNSNNAPLKVALGELAR
jgi:hypothetical protein